MDRFGVARIVPGVLAPLAVLITSCALAGCSAPADPSPSRGPGAAMDRIVPGLLVRHDVPGAQIAVIQDGAVVWRGSYGAADRETGTPVMDDTLFNVGSISKLIAAWAVMTMIEEGNGPAIDSPVGPHLRRWRIPESPFDTEGVTVRRLLGHTAGLSVLPASESFTYPAALEEILTRSYGSFGRLRLVRAPGSGFEYSNGNYLVLQLLIEDVTREAYAAYARRRVLRPLGMRHSAFRDEGREGRAATPHDASGSPLPPDATSLNRGFDASGGLFSTAGDLAAFVAAAMPGPDGAPAGRGVLTPATINLMVRPTAESRGRFGLGYRMLPFSDDLMLIGHEGTNPGWLATLMAASDRGVGIVILTNGSAGAGIVADIVCTWADGDPAMDLGEHCDGPVPIPTPSP